MIEISVKDSGIGIKKDRQKKIFNIFDQSDETVARQYGGTGLGLSVSKKLIELHGGSIRVESEEGKGANFIFTIPKSKLAAKPIKSIMPGYGESEPTTEIVNLLKAHKRKKNAFEILIVDDEPINQHVLFDYLKNTDYNLNMVTNGFEAIKFIKKQRKPDLVLLDLMMPGMSGFEVCRRIRNDYPQNELPIIILTAKNQLQDLINGLSSGANDYISKPFSKDELLARISTHLNLLKINDAYSRFVPKGFVKALEKDSIINVKLGDHLKKQMTVMFSDIRSFTSLSEKLNPEENFNFINEYLKYMIPCIRNNNGFIDKYIGDAIMAIFPNKPDDALNAALESLKELQVFNETRKKKKESEINVGIGIHTGDMMLGTIGNHERMDGTVISDSVNLASRIEDLTKSYGASLVLSEDTYKQLSNIAQFRHRFLFNAMLKGKQNAIRVYDFFEGEQEHLVQLKESYMNEYNAGINAFMNKEFSKAVALFDEILSINSEDNTARFYLKNAARFVVEGVADDWDGAERIE